MPTGKYIRKPHSPKPIKERLEKYISMEPMTGCWLWTGATETKGYGCMSISKHRRWVKVGRIVWELFRYPIPEGLCVLHHCDTPACCNPEHLFLGTYADNNRDSAKKGRSAGFRRKGELHPLAKLTNAQVGEIKKDKRDSRIIGPEYGVGVLTINDIRSGRRWKHIA
jgi:hypothetical protein